MKSYNVRIFNPFRNCEEIYKNVPETQINHDGSFYFNSSYPKCAVLSIKEVESPRIRAMAAYASRYGFANE